MGMAGFEPAREIIFFLLSPCAEFIRAFLNTSRLLFFTAHTVEREPLLMPEETTQEGSRVSTY
jgi:hypothetical protein